ncbi:PrsW family glutamic-type intramembrane protease [Pelagibacteraceae bacterium]|nr:PrsW family glutamic-type intramembrane protease [Pelagibacteraceae bacterium]
MTLLITILPSLAILFYFIYSDKFKEPRKIIIITFLLGVLITIPAGYLNHYVMESFENNSKVNNALIGGFFAGGLVEESLKFLVFYFYVLKEKAFNEPMDAIVYGVVVSLGFATLENYDYVFRIAEEYEMSPLDMAIGRAYTAVPMHALCGVIMGFYFGMYAFVSGGKNLSLALIVPYIFHGTYNFLCAFPPYYIFVIFILLVFSYLLHKNVKETQRLKKKEHEEKII